MGPVCKGTQRYAASRIVCAAQQSAECHRKTATPIDDKPVPCRQFIEGHTNLDFDGVNAPSQRHQDVPLF